MSDQVFDDDNMMLQMMGDWPQSDEDLQASQDYLLDLVEMTKFEVENGHVDENEGDLYQRAVDDYMALAAQLAPEETIVSACDPTPVGDLWLPTKDGDPDGLELYKRHYSCDPNRRASAKLFVGPGEKLVMLTPDKRALFAWRLSRYRHDDQRGVECTVFRSETTGVLSSELISDAEYCARKRWPLNTRLFTFVNTSRVVSEKGNTNPGYCFKKAGWKKEKARTKKGLLIFTKTVLPETAYIPWHVPSDKETGSNTSLSQAGEQPFYIERVRLRGLKVTQLMIFDMATE